MKVTGIFISILLSSFLSTPSFAQLSENFSDGDFSQHPVWTGDTISWLVNNSFQLQSNHTAANSSFYLSTENNAAISTQWDMSVQLSFNPSSLNYVDVFLAASNANLSDKNTTGYFVRLGGTDDEISLFRKDSNGIASKIIDGTNGVLNRSNNLISLRITRDSAYKWTLLRNVSANSDFYPEGTVTDSTFEASAYFGFLVTQSSASFFKKHFFDDIEIKPFVRDVSPPIIQSVNTISANAIDVLFSEPVDAATANVTPNYLVNNQIGNPATAVKDSFDNALVHLTFTNHFPDGKTNSITVNNVKDLAGNLCVNAISTFSFSQPEMYDVIIDEILADPIPQVGLPNAEYIEIKNVSEKVINLQGWKLNSASTQSKSFPNIELPADSFLIITSSANAAFFSAFGKVLGITSFPNLTNGGTMLWLTSTEGKTIHTISYNTSWFQNDVISNGGWSLEMIDTHNPCSSADNWKASTDTKGGTPGKKNSIDGINPDKNLPQLVRAVAIDSVTALLTFSETVDSSSAANVVDYLISDGVGAPVSAVAIAPEFTKVQLVFALPFVANKIYSISANNISDCSGNSIQAINTTRFGLPAAVDPFDVVVNEILFNPKPGAVDYVEIYNRSNKILNAKDLFITNRSSTNALGTLQPVTTDDLLIFPGDYFVLSENGNTVKQHYYAKNINSFIDVAMPSLPDDEGVVVLLNKQKQIIDELHYNSKWHFDLIDNEEGISLERKDYNKPTQDKNNWTSAASTVGYGTPSYQNSQFGSATVAAANITVTPKTFSPDGDGFEDFTNINYQMASPGYVANITIFDAAGRTVKSIAKNATLALSGTFKWNGLDDKSNKVATGVYVVYTEIFNLDGNKRSFKNAVIVAGRL